MWQKEAGFFYLCWGGCSLLVNRRPSARLFHLREVLSWSPFVYRYSPPRIGNDEESTLSLPHPNSTGISVLFF